MPFGEMTDFPEFNRGGLIRRSRESLGVPNVPMASQEGRNSNLRSFISDIEEDRRIRGNVLWDEDDSVLNNYAHQTAWDRFNFRKKIALDEIREASSHLRRLRQSTQVTEEELNQEVKLLHAQETLHLLCTYRNVPVQWSSNWSRIASSLSIQELSFVLRKCPEVDSCWPERFVCVMIYDTDVKVSRLTSAQGDTVRFPGVFWFQTAAQFEVEVKIFSIGEKARTSHKETKRFFHTLSNSGEIATSNFIYHGNMKLIQNQVGAVKASDFNNKPLSRVGEVSVDLSFTTPSIRQNSSRR